MSKIITIFLILLVLTLLMELIILKLLNKVINRVIRVERKCKSLEGLLRENITEGIVDLHSHIDSKMLKK